MPEPRTCYVLTRAGADVAAELADNADPDPIIFDHQADAIGVAARNTPDGEPWRDHWTVYEVRPVQ